MEAFATGGGQWRRARQHKVAPIREACVDLARSPASRARRRRGRPRPRSFDGGPPRARSRRGAYSNRGGIAISGPSLVRGRRPSSIRTIGETSPRIFLAVPSIASVDALDTDLCSIQEVEALALFLLLHLFVFFFDAFLLLFYLS